MFREKTGSEILRKPTFPRTVFRTTITGVGETGPMAAITTLTVHMDRLTPENAPLQASAVLTKAAQWFGGEVDEESQSVVASELNALAQRASLRIVDGGGSRVVRLP